VAVNITFGDGNATQLFLQNGALVAYFQHLYCCGQYYTLKATLAQQLVSKSLLLTVLPCNLARVYVFVIND
jgi:hypothetical protein